MKDMKMSKAERKEMLAMPEPSKEEYPYGLRISLDHEALKKLGIEKLPAVGSEFSMEALCCVIATHQSDHVDGKEPYRSLELQITNLGLDDDSAEKEPASKKLYGKTASKE